MWRSLAAWLVMLFLAGANGAVRDFAYGPRIGELAAHQLSTLTLVILLGAVIWANVRLDPPTSAAAAWRRGLSWTGLTLAFEFLFFHYAGGRPWAELLANYDVLAGRVWVAVPVWIAVAPALFSRLRRGA